MQARNLTPHHIDRIMQKYERPATLNTCPKSEKKTIVTVESHQQVLEHIHAVLRRQRKLCDWTMVHYDSHADLACPNNLPARLCYLPRDSCTTLYDHLESTTTGIAEWILPLVLGASLSRIEWVRPATSQVSAISSFSNGSHSFNVGVWLPPDLISHINKPSFLELPDEARVKVDSPIPYYADDDAIVLAPDSGSASYCQTHELILSQPVNLHVYEELTNFPTQRGPWLLDVCLDFFYCLNPFWVDLHELNARFADALKYLVLESVVFSSHMIEGGPYDYDSRCSLVRRFRLLLTQLIQASAETPSDDESGTIQALLPFYSEPKGALDAISTMQSALVSIQSIPDATTRLIRVAVEALPYLTLPHDNHLEIEHRLQQFSSFLRRQKQDSEASVPFLTTIARSSHDGFISEELADQLGLSVSQIIHDTFCQCGRDLAATDAEGGPFSSRSACGMVLLVDH